jgi:hypothetical protein
VSYFQLIRFKTLFKNIVLNLAHAKSSLYIANVQQNDNVHGELVEPHSTLRQTQGERFCYQIKVR